jgi:hypothetical protein
VFQKENLPVAKEPVTITFDKDSGIATTLRRQLSQFSILNTQVYFYNMKQIINSIFKSEYGIFWYLLSLSAGAIGMFFAILLLVR